MPASPRLRIGAGNASLRPGFRGAAGLAHIAMLIPGLGGGGAERSTLAVSAGLSARGHRVDLVFSRSPERFYPVRIPEGVRPVFCGAGPEAGRDAMRFAMPESAIWLDERPARSQWLGLALRLLRRGEGLALLRRRVLRRAFALLPYLQRERPDIVFSNAPSFEAPLYILTQNQIVTPPPHNSGYP